MNLDRYDREELLTLARRLRIRFQLVKPEKPQRPTRSLKHAERENVQPRQGEAYEAAGGSVH